MGDRRVGIPQDPNSTAGIVIDAGDTKTLDLVAPGGININGAPLAGGTSHTHTGAYEALDPNVLTAGEAVINRLQTTSSSIALGSSQSLRLTYFTARKTEAIASIITQTGGVAAAATPTLCRVGIWTSDATGALLALAASTANDTALWATINTEYNKAFQASFAKVAGQRYALGLLCVSGGAVPTFRGMAPTALAASFARSPVLAGRINSQADLPASAAAGALTFDTTQMFYAELVP